MRTLHPPRRRFVDTGRTHAARHLAILLLSGLLFGAAYTLWMYKRVVFGAVANPHVGELQDINLREFLVLGLLVIPVLAMGIWPQPFAEVLHTSVNELLTHVSYSKLPVQ